MLIKTAVFDKICSVELDVLLKRFQWTSHRHIGQGGWQHRFTSSSSKNDFPFILCNKNDPSWDLVWWRRRRRSAVGLLTVCFLDNECQSNESTACIHKVPNPERRIKHTHTHTYFSVIFFLLDSGGNCVYSQETILWASIVSVETKHEWRKRWLPIFSHHP